MKIRNHFLYKIAACTLLAAMLVCGSPCAGTAYAAEEFAEQMEQRKTLPIQSNANPDWPQGPAIGAQSAILMEMNTHTILYAKISTKKAILPAPPKS